MLLTYRVATSWIESMWRRGSFRLVAYGFEEIGEGDRVTFQ